MSDSTERTATSRDLMDRFQVTRPTITSWIEAGCPHEREGEGSRAPLRFDLDEVVQWVKTTGRTMRRGGDRRSLSFRSGSDNQNGTNGTINQIELEHAEAKLRKDLAAAEKAEMELDRLRDKLLDADEVKMGHLDRIARARAVLLGGPSSLAPDLVGLDQPAIEARLKDWVCLSLAELASEGD